MWCWDGNQGLQYARPALFHPGPMFYFLTVDIYSFMLHMSAETGAQAAEVKGGPRHIRTICSVRADSGKIGVTAKGFLFKVMKMF